MNPIWNPKWICRSRLKRVAFKLGRGLQWNIFTLVLSLDQEWANARWGILTVSQSNLIIKERVDSAKNSTLFVLGQNTIMRNPTNSSHRHKINLYPIAVLTSALSLMVVASASQANSSEREIKSVSLVQSAKPTKVGYTKTNRRSTRKTYLGSAPYICSPSGFGRTSSCKLRVSYN